MLLVIEGTDGAGKTTQLNMLCEFLGKSGVKFRKLEFPRYGEPTCELVRMYLNGDFGSDPDSVNAYAASSFYAVDRIGSYLSDWKKDTDKLIVTGRYTTSNAIHQTAKLPENEKDEYLNWLFHYEYELLGLPRPDKVIFLHMPYKAAESNIDKRNEKRDIHEKDADYLRRCCDNAVYVANKLNWKIIECTDGERIKTPLEIHNEIKEELYGLRIFG